MPRRKKTRKNQTSRMRPMLPEGDLDTSMSIDERRAKLDVYLKDLNMQGWFSSILAFGVLNVGLIIDLSNFFKFMFFFILTLFVSSVK